MLFLLSAHPQTAQPETYLLRIKYAPSQVIVEHVKEEIESWAGEPAQRMESEKDEFDLTTTVFKVMPNGDAILFANRNPPKNYSQGEAKKVLESRYQLMSTRHGLIKEGSSPSQLQTPPFNDVDGMIPFPAGPVQVGSSWIGTLKEVKIGAFPEKCTLSKIEEKSGVVYAWLDTTAELDFPESKVDLKPTSVDVKGR